MMKKENVASYRRTHTHISKIPPPRPDPIFPTQEFRAAEISFFLHKECHAAGIRFYLHKALVTKNKLDIASPLGGDVEEFGHFQRLKLRPHVTSCYNFLASPLEGDVEKICHFQEILLVRYSGLWSKCQVFFLVFVLQRLHLHFCRISPL